MRTIAIAALTALVAGLPGYGQTDTVDYRYAPVHSFSAICFPDDWQKTVVTSSGALGADFGPGPYAKALTEVSFGVKEGVLNVLTHRFKDARVPQSITEYASDGITMQVEGFACVPARSGLPITRFKVGKSAVERFDGVEGCMAWASPGDSVDPAFRSVAWGVNRAILYRVRVNPGSRTVVALGLCEPYKPGPGARVLELRVEGGTPVVADPLVDGRKNTPHTYVLDGEDADHDGWLRIESHGTTTCPDPNTILNAFWVFPEGFIPDQARLIRGELNTSAEVFWNCGIESELQAPSPRHDILQARVTSGTCTPVVRIATGRALAHNQGSATVTSDGKPFLTIVPTPIASHQVVGGWEFELAAGTSEAAVVVTHGWPGPETLLPEDRRIPTTLDDIASEKARAEQFWRATLLPYDKISVPDGQIQGLLTASIRNLYQIRESVNGLRQFQPGPSVYRGLWVHDALWHVIASAMLGDSSAAHEGLEVLLRHQDADGRVRVMAPYLMNRETPLTISVMIITSRMLRDTVWLKSHWSSVERGIEWLWNQRARTLNDPRSVGYGLFPPAFADGGLGGISVEYGSAYWALAGLRIAAEGARWTGNVDDARRWEKYYQQMWESFQAAAKRDMRRDASGNLYLPMKAGDTSHTTPPQQANWAILEAQNYAHIFPRNDSLLVGSLAMLRSGMREGLPVNTGWLKDGLWPFFAMIQAVSHLDVGEAEKAIDMVYAIANHASPLGTWVEEQLPRDLGTRTTGDGSNASASALFVQLIRRLLVNETPGGIDLLAGVPDAWLKPGSLIALNGVPTFAGTCTLRVAVRADGLEAQISVGAMRPTGKDEGPKISLVGFKRKGFVQLDGKELPDVYEGRWGEALRITLRNDRGRGDL